MKRVLCLLLVAAAVSCSENALELPHMKQVDVDGVELAHEMIVLGKQLDDPYTVDNMTKALKSLYPTKAGELKIATTDLYVRFLPKNQEQYETLAACCPDMLDHPVDYQILREGDYYMDPELPEGSLTWQYAVIEKDFVFPAGIKYEVLDECYIAEHDVVTRAGDDFIYHIMTVVSMDQSHLNLNHLLKKMNT